MILACIFCGGIIETTLVFMGFGLVYGWFKNRHKKKCDCCKEHGEKDETNKDHS